MAILIAVFVLTKIGLPGLITAESQDWNFIGSVGGMKVELAGDRLLVACNVSGAKTITTRPTIVNSGMGIRELKTSRSDYTIFLTVVTAAWKKGMSTECDSISLSEYPAGAYAIAYLDPNGTTHPLGTLLVP